MRVKLWGGPYHNEWKDIIPGQDIILIEVNYEYDDVFMNSFSPAAFFITKSHYKAYVRDPDLHAGNAVFYYKET